MNIKSFFPPRAASGNLLAVFLLQSIFPALLTVVPAQAQTPNSWTVGTPMPTARQGPFTGVIGSKIYVVGGITNTSIINVNEIYDTATSTWSTGAPMPTARWLGASAVVNNVLYAIAGAANGQLNIVEAYDPSTDTWSTKAAMPVVADSVKATVLNDIVYVVGGYNGASGRLTTVLSYNPALDVWSMLAPLNLGKSESAVGLLGSTIISAGGLANSGATTTDTEGYNAATNSWKTLASMPTARQAGCFGVIAGLFYVAGGTSSGGAASGARNVVESYNPGANTWTSGLPSVPTAVVAAGSAVVGDTLYCFGGSNNGVAEQGTVYDYVQIYQPPPAINPGGVVPVFSSATTIQPGSWISIYGSNLAETTTVWTGNFPLNLGDVTVTIDNKSAYIWYVSPGQINVQAPDDATLGPIPVVVSTEGTTAASTVTLAPYAPSFSMLSGKYPAAIVLTPGSPGNSGGGYDIIGPVGAFSYPTRPAKVGETLQVYGVGFGPTNPPVPAGQVFTGPAAVSPVFPTVTIGGLSATVQFSGIVEAGLFQLNVIVPNAASGDQQLIAQIGGTITPSNVYVTIQ